MLCQPCRVSEGRRCNADHSWSELLIKFHSSRNLLIFDDIPDFLENVGELLGELESATAMIQSCFLIILACYKSYYGNS